MPTTDALITALLDAGYRYRAAAEYGHAPEEIASVVATTAHLSSVLAACRAVAAMWTNGRVWGGNGRPSEGMIDALDGIVAALAAADDAR